jgi:hypothetical protein
MLIGSSRGEYGLMRNKVLLAVLFCVVGSWHARAQASTPLGSYIGAAVGHATIRADQVSFLDNGMPLTPPASYSASDTGWKVFAGVRPISLLGAEIEYVDFGNSAASKTITGYGLGYTLHMGTSSTLRFRLRFWTSMARSVSSSSGQIRAAPRAWAAFRRGSVR